MCGAQWRCQEGRAISTGKAAQCGPTCEGWVPRAGGLGAAPGPCRGRWALAGPFRLAVRGPVRAPAPLHKRGLCGCHPRLLEDRFFLVQALPLSRGHDNTAALPPHQHPPLPDCLQLYNYQKFLYFGANYLVAYIT